MPIHVEWYDPKARIIRCDISGQWDAKSFQVAYRAMFDLARTVNDKVALICDIRNAEEPGDLDEDIRVVASAFIGVVVFVVDDAESPLISAITEIFREHAPHALFTHKTDIAAARQECLRLLPRVITNIYMS